MWAAYKVSASLLSPIFRFHKIINLENPDFSMKSSKQPHIIFRREAKKGGGREAMATPILLKISKIYITTSGFGVQ